MKKQRNNPVNWVYTAVLEQKEKPVIPLGQICG
jgi:hypothetical protein